MNQKIESYESFLCLATIALSALMGLLIASPLATSYAQASQFNKAYLVFTLFTAAGALVGYRRRKSRAFLYFCMIGCAVLASIISTSLVG